MEEKCFVILFKNSKYWVKIGHDGNTTLNVTMINSATGESFEGSNFSCAVDIFSTIQDCNSTLREGPRKQLFLILLNCQTHRVW
jgi:hypothetical protein